MPKRNANSPWGSSYKEGLPTTSVNDSVEIDQMVRPMLDCGVISKETGQWEGITTSDPQFIGLTRALAVANGATASFPDTNEYPSIDMSGYNTVFIALKPSNGGNVQIQAIMGPNTEPSGGLTPVNSGAVLKYSQGYNGTSSAFTTVLDDSTESLTADVWNIFRLEGRMADFDNAQFRIENNSGGNSDIEFAFRRTTI